MNVKTFNSDLFKHDTGLTAGHRVCAIGDVHGNAKQMAALLDGYEATKGDYDKTSLVILGDLNDRGPDNLVAFDLAIQASERFDDVFALQGNHEAMMRIAIEQDNPEISKVWNKHGGQDVMKEIGLEKLAFGNKVRFRESLEENVGAARMDYLRNLQSHQFIGNLLFVHAGTDPKASLEEHLAQPWDECFGNHWCWIREPFIQNPVVFDSHPNLCVIHGHTPVSRRAYRVTDNPFSGHQYALGKINLDGGSYGTGCVTGAEFTADAYRINCAIIYR